MNKAIINLSGSSKYPINEKPATSQEIMMLQRIPAAGSGYQITLTALVGRLAASQKATGQLLARLHTKGLVAIENPDDERGNAWVQRTSLAEVLMIKRSAGRPPK